MYDFTVNYRFALTKIPDNRRTKSIQYLAMGWLPGWMSWGSGSTKSGANATDFAEPPNRKERVKCWDSRDLFFECLDKNGILDAIKDNEKAQTHCSSELKVFEKNCATSWVTYFKQRRVAEFEKAQLLKKQEQDMFKKP